LSYPSKIFYLAPDYAGDFSSNGPIFGATSKEVYRNSGGEIKGTPDMAPSGLSCRGDFSEKVDKFWSFVVMYLSADGSSGIINSFDIEPCNSV
jgi:hypothetical protein